MGGLRAEVLVRGEGVGGEDAVGVQVVGGGGARLGPVRALYLSVPDFI